MTLVGVILLLWLTPSSASAYSEDKIGFNSRLAGASSVVSGTIFQSVRDEQPVLGIQLPLRNADRPRLLIESATFDPPTVRYTTTIHRSTKLVPATVDAYELSRYRFYQYASAKLDSLAYSSLVEAKQTKRRSGVSLGVALPKKLDRLFGEGGGNLRLTGSVSVRLGARQQVTDGLAGTGTSQDKSWALELDQISRFEMSGTIGTKISVRLSQDNKTTVPLANRIQIRYKGDDDDVIKTIEAGNTTLNLPGTQFVGYASQIQGLFGLKAEAVLGNLSLTAIASQEKGSSEKTTINSTGDESAQIIRDYQYAEGRLFDLAYLQISPFSTGGVYDFQPGDSVVRLEVYESRSAQENTLPLANIYINPNDTASYNSFRATQLRVLNLKSGEDYDFEQLPSQGRWVIHFRSSKLSNIGIYYEFIRDGVRLKVGKHEEEPYLLKYLRGNSDLFKTSNHPAWNLMWRNVYAVTRNSRVEDLNIKVFRGTTAEQGTDAAVDFQRDVNGNSVGKLIGILGLDQYTTSNERRTDDKVDDRRDVFRSDWGLLIFPSRFPFSNTEVFVDSLARRTARLEPRYDTALFYGRDQQSVAPDAKNYYIQLASRTRSSIIRLNRTNIIEGSERVILNGSQLTRDTDYKIQYDFGQITLTNDQALDPNSDLKIEFEYAPFLSLAKKTLLGTRADYRLSKDARIGTTLLYKSDKAQDRKPRVGQETSEMSIFDVDGSINLYPSFLSKVVDLLPFYSTTTNSTLSISGEYAQSNPNPNVLGSAYIDDFEAATEQISLSTTHSSWLRGSRPKGVVSDAKESKMLWFNPGGIPFDEVYAGERPTNEGTIIPLYLLFRPSDTTYDRVDSTRAPNVYSSIMRYFGNRVDESRLRLFEVRLKGNSGVLHFDFGAISEDVIVNGINDTEDKNLNNGLEAVEDLGLDGIADVNERGPDGSVYDAASNPDPAGDNFYYSQGGVSTGICPNPSLCDNPQFQYEWVNGTEGNRQYLPVLGRPDEEALGPNGFIDADNYFSFRMDLSDTLSPNSFYVRESRNDSGWATYRIPIRDPASLDRIQGTPRWDQITHVRVWWEAPRSQPQQDLVAIANWYFVQAYWQDTLISQDTTAKFVVATVSEEDNTYSPPEEVEDYTDPTTGVTESQRALALNYSGFQTGDSGFAVRRLLQNERYSGYKTLKMYVHGPDQLPGDSLLFVLRLGTDSVNYYEYTVPLQPGWNEQNHVDLDFQVLTNLKDSFLQDAVPGQPVRGRDGRYAFVGRPSFNNIGYYSLGVVNVGQTTLSGEVWVDELRVDDPRRDKGTAFRASVSGTAADLLSYSFNYSNKDAFFRQISTATRGGGADNLGSGISSEDLGFSARINVERFLPKSWGASLPVSYSQSERTELPLLRTGTDIVLSEATRDAEKTFNRSRRIEFSESFQGPAKNPFFGLLLNRQKFNFSITQSEGFSVVQPYRFTDAYNASGSFDLGIKKFPKISPFSWTKGIPVLQRLSKSKLTLYPSDWTINGAFDRSIGISQDPGGVRTSTLSRGLSGRTSLSLKPFDNLGTTFRAGSTWDMSRTDSVRISFRGLRLGRQTSFDQNFSADYDPKLLKWWTARLAYTSNYNERPDNSTGSRSGTMGNTVRIGGNFSQTILFAKPKPLPAPPRRPFELPGFSIDPKVWHPPMSFDSTLFRRQWSVPLLATRTMLEDLRPPKPAYPFYDAPFSLMRGLVGWLKPVTYAVSFGYNNTTPGMLVRPSLAYRFGFKSLADVPVVQIGSSVVRTGTFSWEAGTGARFFGGSGGSGLTVDVKYKFSENTDLERVVGASLTRTVTRSRPDVGISIGQMPSFPIFRKQVNDFIAIFNPRTGYNVSERKSYSRTRGDSLTGRSITKSFNPLLGVTFRPARSVNLAATITKSTTETDQYNVVDVSYLSTTSSRRDGVTIQGSYSFKSPTGIAIPILGRLRFNSDVTIGLDITSNKDFTETLKKGVDPSPSVHKKSLTIKPRVVYQFSSQIQGGVDALFLTDEDRITGRKSNTNQVNANVELRF